MSTEGKSVSTSQVTVKAVDCVVKGHIKIEPQRNIKEVCRAAQIPYSASRGFQRYNCASCKRTALQDPHEMWMRLYFRICN